MKYVNFILILLIATFGFIQGAVKNEKINNGRYVSYFSNADFSLEVSSSASVVSLRKEKGNIKSIINYSKDKRNGLYFEYRNNRDNTLKIKAHYKDDMLEGTYTSYYPNGSVEEKRLYSKDKRNGIYFKYRNDEDSTLKIKAYYKDDMLEGVYIEFFPNGKIKEKKLYSKGEIKDENNDSQRKEKQKEEYFGG